MATTTPGAGILTAEQTEFIETANPALLTPELLKRLVNEEDTLLIYAVKVMKVNCVLALLAAGADKNEPNKKGVTPISAAATKGITEIIEPLIDAGAQVDELNQSGSTALIQASHFGHYNAVKVLLDNKADADFANGKGTTALMRASQEGHVRISRLLIESGAKVTRKNLEGMNALMLASQRGHADMATLLTNAGAVVDEQTAQGSTALMLACKRGHDQVVEVLVSMGAEIYIKDNRDRTARDTALRREHTSLLKWLDTRKQRDQIQSRKLEQRGLVLKKIHQLHARGELALEDVSQRAAGLYEQHILKAGSSFSVVPLSQADVEAVTHLSARIAAHNSPRPSPASKARPGYADWQWHYVLLSSLALPEGLYAHICKFIPNPRTWQLQLKALKVRCELEPRQAIADTSEIIDEILADANIFQGRDQTQLLVKCARNPQLHAYLENGLGMKPSLIEAIVCNSDVQSLAARTSEKKVVFMSPMAKDLLDCAEVLFKWQETRSCSGRAMGISSDDAEAQAAALGLACTDRESDGDMAMAVEDSSYDQDAESKIPPDGESEGDMYEEGAAGEGGTEYGAGSEAEYEDDDMAELDVEGQEMTVV